MGNYLIFGDVHGQLDEMYARAAQTQALIGQDIDQLLEVGDFHTIRDEKDLQRFPAPEHHKQLGDYPSYVQKGEVPLLTKFLGGNHENFQLLDTLPQGGELIRNLHYLGRSGVQHIGADNFTFGWVSGNYSEKGFVGERKKKKSAHFTQEDVEKIRRDYSEHLRTHDKSIDVLLFHDWPSINSLFPAVDESTVSNISRFYDAANRHLGCEPLFELVRDLKPKYVFCGHMHTPLSFDFSFRGSDPITFVALDKVGRDHDHVVLNTEYWTLVHSGQDIYSMVPESEQQVLREGILLLEDNNYKGAFTHFNRLLDTALSDITVGFVHYGLGLSQLKQTQCEGINHDVLDDSIKNFHLSLNHLKFADGYLLLAEAYRSKVHHMIMTHSVDPVIDKELIELNGNIISYYLQAVKHNPSYGPIVEKMLIRVKKDISGLEKRLGRTSV